jgi:hypothetical protein
MATTIQLQEKTKNALFLKKNELEHKLKRKITYDELVLYLLTKEERMQPKKSLEELIGTISKEEVQIYNELRKEYHNE